MKFVREVKGAQTLYFAIATTLYALDCTINKQKNTHKTQLITKNCFSFFSRFFGVAFPVVAQA
jgi:hypothetical protein